MNQSESKLLLFIAYCFAMCMNKEHLYNLVKEAWERIEGKVVRTPICRLDWLKSKNNEQVSFFAKFENKQHTGSFKYRGLLIKY